MADQQYFEQNTAKEQGSNLSYLYNQLGLEQVFERLRALEEKVDGVEVRDYPEPALVGQPPRPDYISENEPITVDTPRPVNDHAPTKDNRADEDWDLVQDRTPPVNVEDDRRIREEGDVVTDEEPKADEEENEEVSEVPEPDVPESHEDNSAEGLNKQLSLFDENGNVNEEARWRRDQEEKPE